ncbi:MAG: CoA pyrophosphatase [Legionella sp.]|uniref:NUDIX hydrolase n=1 Tax=Legionella sp. TaxID=459 RepID=UPI0039E2D204
MDLKKPNNNHIPHHAAVMVLYDRFADALILTKRSENLRSHPGEVCFPGGAWEENDQDLYATALRELHEEIGITADRVTFLRELKIQRTLLGSIIHPWLGSVESVIPYQLNPNEVTRLILIPMSLVLLPQNYRDIIVERGKFRFKSCEFAFEGDWVWGATAKIMKQLTKNESPKGFVF